MQSKIIEIKEKIIQQFSKVENILKQSIDGLEHRDNEKLNEVIQVMEPEVNANELSIEEKCTNYIALFTPEAKNLRYILMMLKMNNDAERAGDLGVNIAESSLYLVDKPIFKQEVFDDVLKMSHSALNMFHDSITAFIDENSDLAKQIIKRDHKVNDLQEKILKELKDFMMNDTTIIKRGLHFIRIAHNLERVGDLATNICEDTIYIVDGISVKHIKLKEKTNV